MERSRVLAPRKIHTLIADDSAAFSAVVREWIAMRPELEWVGTVGSGPDAIDAVERLCPDLVLLDAVLPRLDGFRVVRELKSRSPTTRVVVMTFLANRAAREAAIAAGADGFLAKDEFAEGLELLLPELRGDFPPLRGGRRIES